MQGTLVVGAVDHAAGMISMATTAPNYGTAVMTLTYRPSSAVTAATHSGATMITTANQGRAFTDVLEPPPAPGSLSISFMAQGRWYELLDNMAGKIVGADSSYGVGTINYATGSLSVTLGAIPDVDSALIYTWGDSATAKGIIGDLPARAWSKLAMPARARLDGLTLQWSRDAVNYTAVMDAAGVLSGDAQGRAEGGHIRFEPDVFPDGQVTIVCDLGPESSNLVNGNIIQNLQLTAGLPIVPGSFTGKVLATFPPNATSPESPVNVFDRDGIVYVDAPNGGGALGVIDYNTGVISCQGSLNIKIMVDVVKTYADGPLKGEQYVAMEEQTKAIAYSGVTVTSYAYGSGVQQHTVQRDPLPWVVQVPVAGSRMVLTGCAFKLGSDIYTASAGTLLRGWNLANGQPTSAAAGTINSAGLITLASLPGNFTNGLQWFNAAVDLSGGLVTAGVFRTDNAPLKQGVFQLQIGARVGTINASGVLSGGDFSGSVDSYRGIVRWRNVDPIDVSALSYNTVFLQYLPLDSTLLGIGTSSLPLDGRVPIFRAGDLCVVHHTQALTLPNPVPRDAVHTLGRQRLATVRVLDALGAVVADTLYTADLDAGTMSVPAASDLSGYVQPLTVEHRIEDMLQCTEADISGRLKFSQSLTHDFPAGSYVSSALQFGDLFARVSTYIEQATWTSVWQDTRIGSAITANFNEAAFPIAVTNRGAITERWAMIFTATTTFRIVGESVGEIGTGSVNEACAPINPATLTPYFSIPPLGWGGGWSAGNVLRFNTSACGAPFWVVRTVLQGPASVTSDRFTVAFRGDVDRP